MGYFNDSVNEGSVEGSYKWFMQITLIVDSLEHIYGYLPPTYLIGKVGIYNFLVVTSLFWYNIIFGVDNYPSNKYFVHIVVLHVWILMSKYIWPCNT